MDQCDIPAFALRSYTGTVVTRVKMEVEFCESKFMFKYPIVHRQCGCEECSRTRTNREYSACDSGVLRKSRPYRSSSARSRYVNVCAAFCLVVLAGCLSPQSIAAPFPFNMAQENSTWRNPCDYSNPGTKPVTSLYTPEQAEKVARQASSTLKFMTDYSDKLAQSFYGTPFQVASSFVQDPWLRLEFKDDDLVLPGGPVTEEHVNNVIQHADKSLPKMYKALKLILASFHEMNKERSNDNFNSDDADALNMNVTKTMNDIRGVLCCFYDLMISRDLEIIPLLDNEIPNLKVNKPVTEFAVFRDTMQFLDYLNKVFDKMYQERTP